MPRQPETQIFSIFGQIEEVVAKAMIDEGKLTRIEADLIPFEALYNEEGTKAKFAVVLPRVCLGEFNLRVERLRA